MEGILETKSASSLLINAKANGEAYGFWGAWWDIGCMIFGYVILRRDIIGHPCVRLCFFLSRTTC